MASRILLVNPPIYDFSAHDFWLKPYGLLSVGGYLRDAADLLLFDYLDRLHPRAPQLESDSWGRGKYHSDIVPKPVQFSHVPRYYRRHGLPRKVFQEFLADNQPWDYALIQTVMTYWYPGVREVIEDIRTFSPETRIVLGGVYATLCTDHAQTLGADFVLKGDDLAPLWAYMGLTPNLDALPYWEGYPDLDTAILKLADGCPFRCTYCSVPQTHPQFELRPLDRSLAELESLHSRGVRNVAFYDDALLFKADRIIVPFLEEALRRRLLVNFHTPNALNARFVTPELADLMVRAGFKTFYLGFESRSYEWQRKTGGKVYEEEFARAVGNLTAAGACPEIICAYLIIGHPNNDNQGVEDSMRYASGLGVRVMLSEFSPVPGTPDGETGRRWVDMAEPLNHNKIAFSQRTLGTEAMDWLKCLCRELNGRVEMKTSVPAHALKTGALAGA